MTVIILDTSEVKAVGHDIQRNAGRVYRKTQTAVRRGAIKTQARAQVNAPVDTGALKSSITTTVTDLTFEVGPEVNYGGYVELGTSGPYPIHDAFGWGITVMHPGNDPEPYLAPAYDATLPSIVDDILNAGSSILGTA